MAGDIVGTATFLMTDIESSTRLWESQAERMPDLLARHDALIARAVVGNGGSLVKLRGEGDSHFAVFERAAGAVLAAVDLQRALAGDDALAAVPIRVRVGIHTGDASFRGMDYYGPAVNRCARIRGVGAGGQILASESAMALAADSLPPEMGFRDLGHHRLRDLLRPERLFQVVAPGIGDGFPGIGSLNDSNIPLQLTSFVGREAELAEIGRRLGEARLLTLLGPGGVGKTRVAYQAAAEVAGRYADGVRVAELAEVQGELGVLRAVADAVGVPSSSASADTVAAALREQAALLVLDNCEHVLEAVRPLVRRVLAECPKASVLVTSRQLLRLPGEASREVPPLGLPPESPESLEAVLGSEAGRLFVERARLVASHFEATERNMGAIARVCATLDGLPLAIELAAARCNVLSPTQIDERLSNRFAVLGGRSGEGRHGTMRAAIDWSFRMLDGPERLLMGRLTAFRGGWTCEAMETALAERWPFGDDPLDVLQCLVERSLVFVEDLAGETARYRLLETIRDFALETTSAEELAAAGEGLFEWAEAFAAEAEHEMEGAEQQRWFEAADAGLENLRLAVLWGLRREGMAERSLAIVMGLHRFWVARGHFAVGRSLLEPLLASDVRGTSELLARSSNLLGVLAMCQGDLEFAERWLVRGLSLSREIGNKAAEGATLCNLGMIAWEQKDGISARRWYEEAVGVLQESGDRGRLGSALLNLGSVLTDMGLYAEALTALESSLPPLRERGDLSRIAYAIGNLGDVAIACESWNEARGYTIESLSAFSHLGEWKGTLNQLVGAATILLVDRNLEAVATLRGAMDSMVRLARTQQTPRDQQRISVVDEVIHHHPDRPSMERCKQRGRRLSPQVSIAFAINALKMCDIRQ